MGRGYQNPSGTEMRFDFSSTLGMCRVTGKYIGIGYGDGEGKTRPHPAPLPCLISIHVSNFFCFIHVFVFLLIYQHECLIFLIYTCVSNFTQILTRIPYFIFYLDTCIYFYLYINTGRVLNFFNVYIVGYLSIGFIVAKNKYPCMMLDTMFQHLCTVLLEQSVFNTNL